MNAINALLASVWPTWFGDEDAVTSSSGMGWTEIGPEAAQTPSAAYKIPAFFAGIRNIAEDMGKFPLHVKRRLGVGRAELAEDHPVYRLLFYEPNPEMSSLTFREILTGNRLTWGNGYAEIERNVGGEAIALWPIHTSRCFPRRIEGRLTYDVINDDGVIVRFEARDILHIRGYGDSLGGYSLLRLARESLGLAYAAQTFGLRFFTKGANVAGAIEYPHSLGAAQIKQMREQWDQEFGGLGKSHGVVVLDNGKKYVRIGIPPEDAQFLQTRQAQNIDICRWLRIQPHKLQDLSRSTNNNIEAQGIDYVTDTLLAHARQWETELDRKLLREPNLFAEFDFRSLLRGDSAARTNYYRGLWGIGCLSQNQILVEEGYNEFEGGDQRWVPVNVQPIERAVQPPARPERPQPPRNEPPNPPEPDSEPRRNGQLGREFLARAIQRNFRREAKAIESASGKADRERRLARWYTDWCADLLEESVFFLGNLGRQDQYGAAERKIREFVEQRKALVIQSNGDAASIGDDSEVVVDEIVGLL